MSGTIAYQLYNIYVQLFECTFVTCPANFLGNSPLPLFYGYQPLGFSTLSLGYIVHGKRNNEYVYLPMLSHGVPNPHFASMTESH